MNDQFVTYASDILGETKFGLSGNEIAKFSTEFAVRNNVENPYGIYPFPKGLPNKKSALRGSVGVFSAEQKFHFIAWLCDMPGVKNQEPVKELKLRLFNNYGNKYSTIDIADSNIISETRHWLGEYPRALEIYNVGLMKFEAQLFERNCIDDIRLAYEVLLKELLGNEKSLENQVSEIGVRLKRKDASTEIRNMYIKLLDYYTKYQNNYVKHDDKVNKNEVEYIVELTSIMMKFLIKILK